MEYLSKLTYVFRYENMNVMELSTANKKHTEN